MRRRDCKYIRPIIFWDGWSYFDSKASSTSYGRTLCKLYMAFLTSVSGGIPLNDYVCDGYIVSQWLYFGRKELDYQCAITREITITEKTIKAVAGAAHRSDNNPLSPIFGRCHVHLFLKNADKMFCCFIADLIGNICNG